MARRLVQLMHADDNVAIALSDLEPGTLVQVERLLPAGQSAEHVTVTMTIPFGHKVALRPIRSGEAVLKYGEAIGLASVEIAAGEHVHVHNVDSQRGRGDLAASQQK
ncbi:MAG TPA: UxaA family hydrolase [Chloroflexota bacterium]|nr:UxaA family hydrolase [Chloroflexota bacterium]